MSKMVKSKKIPLGVVIFGTYIANFKKFVAIFSKKYGPMFFCKISYSHHNLSKKVVCPQKIFLLP